MTDHSNSEVLRHTAAVVSAHLGHNKVAAEMLPALIQSVFQALSGLGTEPEPSVARPEPAVAIRKSVFPDYIVCLEDGAKMKMLKRYIQTRYNLTPAAYRERWGLPADYPMVAPNYTERRSTLAKQIGLGRKRVAEEEPVAAAAGTVAPVPDAVPESGPHSGPESGPEPVAAKAPRKAAKPRAASRKGAGTKSGGG